MPDCPCFAILVDTFNGIEGIVGIVQGYVHHISSAGCTYLMCNNPIANPWNPNMDIYTVWPTHGPRVNDPIFIGKMDQFRASGQEYVSVRATCVRSKYSSDPRIKIEFIFFDGMRETFDTVHSKESFWRTLCTRKPCTLHEIIPRIQTKLLGIGSQHAAELIRDIVYWIEAGVYKKCVANGLWRILHDNS